MTLTITITWLLAAKLLFGTLLFLGSLIAIYNVTYIAVASDPMLVEDQEYFGRRATVLWSVGITAFLAIVTIAGWYLIFEL